MRGQEAYFLEGGSMNDSSDVRDFKAAKRPGIIGAHSRHLAGGLRLPDCSQNRKVSENRWNLLALSR